MKKALLFAAVVAVVSVTACKKDRTCTCTTVSVVGTTSTTSITTTSYPKSTKHDARGRCMSETTIDTGFSTTKTCDLN